MDEGIPVTPAVTIPADELEERATRAGGPGGQHVNTSSTRIELVWDVAGSRALDEAQRAHVMRRLAARLDSAGRLRIVAATHRSQLQNREAARARLAEVVAAALVVPKRRRPTKPTKASRERRLAGKKRRGERKRDRQRPAGDE
jgi:ribosome-associated protein